jgi:hypothetical protein
VRVAALLPLLAAVATAGYAVVVAVFAPGLRSPVATLNMTIVAFLVGVPAYGAHMILPIAADRQRPARVLAVRWHLAEDLCGGHDDSHRIPAAISPRFGLRHQRRPSAGSTPQRRPTPAVRSKSAIMVGGAETR